MNYYTPSCKGEDGLKGETNSSGLNEACIGTASETTFFNEFSLSKTNKNPHLFLITS